MRKQASISQTGALITFRPDGRKIHGTCPCLSTTRSGAGTTEAGPSCTPPIYSVLTTTFNGNYRRALGLSATYTFGYGKKVSRGDEVGSQSDAGSAIM